MPEVKIDRAGLIEIYEALGQVKNTVDEVKYRFRASSMRKQLESVIDPILEQRDTLLEKRPKAFDEERIATCREFAEKNSDGHPVISGKDYSIDPARKRDFDHAMSTVMAKHKDERDAFEAEVNRHNDFLRELIPMPELTGRFPLSAFNKTASQEMLEALFLFIDDDSSSKDSKDKK